MRAIAIIILALGSINITACSSMSGNVVPEKGPPMEQVYDSMETRSSESLIKFRQVKPKTSLPLSAANTTFHKVPNPELKMYVYPHLAGKDEVPVPGYDTAFNAYTQDHYALPNEG